MIFLSYRFMEDLQAEVQEMEFLQFSKGMDTMRREDFAEWLLHYTNEEYNEVYWENMRKKIPAGEVVRLSFSACCQIVIECGLKRTLFSTPEYHIRWVQSFLPVHQQPGRLCLFYENGHWSKPSCGNGYHHLSIWYKWVVSLLTVRIRLMHFSFL